MTQQYKFIPQPACSGCDRIAPQTVTEGTLMSTTHGWRLVQASRPEGGAGPGVVLLVVLVSA